MADHDFKESRFSPTRSDPSPKAASSEKAEKKEKKEKKSKKDKASKESQGANLPSTSKRHANKKVVTIAEPGPGEPVTVLISPRPGDSSTLDVTGLLDSRSSDKGAEAAALMFLKEPEPPVHRSDGHTDAPAPDSKDPRLSSGAPSPALPLSMVANAPPALDLRSGELGARSARHSAGSPRSPPGSPSAGQRKISNGSSDRPALVVGARSAAGTEQTAPSASAESDSVFAEIIDKEAQDPLALRPAARSSSFRSGSAIAGTTAVLVPSASSPKQKRRTPSFSRTDSITPTSLFKRQLSDPALNRALASAAPTPATPESASAKDSKERKEKEASKASKRFSRLSMVLGPLSGQSEGADSGRLEQPDVAGLLVIQLEDAFLATDQTRGVAGDEPVTLNPYCVFSVGGQDARSSVVFRAQLVWHELLNLLCEVGCDSLHLTVYGYDPIGKDQFIGSASLEVKQLIQASRASPDEWGTFAMRIDDAGALVNFRCQYKPFVGGKSDKTRDLFGFELSDKSAKLYKDFMPAHLKKLSERERSLNRLPNWHRPKDPQDLKKFTRRGVPIAHRPEVWLFVSGAKRKMEKDPGLYRKLLADNVSKSTAHTVQIDKDLHRTILNHHLYRMDEGRQALRRVLLAYSWKNAGLGYCQSMNFICGFLLVFMDEESAFWLLATIVEDLLPDYFTRYMIGSKADVQVFKDIAREKLPRLLAHFQRIDYDFTFLLTQWFLCLFTNQLPTLMVLRVMDAFLLEGSKILFRVGLALLKLNEEALLATRSMEEAHSLMKELPAVCFDTDKLMKVAYKELGSLFNSNISGKIKTFREKHLRTYEEGIKKEDFRFLGGHTSFDHGNLEALFQQFQAHAVANESSGSSSTTGADADQQYQDRSHLTLEPFRALVFPSAGEERSRLSLHLFRAFDTNRDQVVDFREFTLGVHILTKGSPDDKLKLLFHGFDDDGDGFLTAEQLGQLLNLQLIVLKQSEITASQKDLLVKNLLAKSTSGKLNFAEFRTGISQVSLLEEALQLASTAADLGRPVSPAPIALTQDVASAPPSAGSPPGPEKRSSAGAGSPKDKKDKDLLPLSASAAGPATSPKAHTDEIELSSRAVAEARAKSPDRLRSPRSGSVVDSPVSQSAKVAVPRKASKTTALPSSRSMTEVAAHASIEEKTGSLRPKKSAKSSYHPDEKVVENPLFRQHLPLQASHKHKQESLRPVADRSSADSRLTGTSRDSEPLSPKSSPRSSALGSSLDTSDRRMVPARRSEPGARESGSVVAARAKRPLVLDSENPLAHLEKHLTIDLSLLSRHQGPAHRALPQPSVVITTSTESSPLRTSDKAIGASTGEALRSSKGLRSSDSALHASLRQVSMKLAGVVDVPGEPPKVSARLRSSRSSENLSKAAQAAQPMDVFPRAADLSVNSSASPSAADAPAPVHADRSLTASGYSDRSTSSDLDAAVAAGQAAPSETTNPLAGRITLGPDASPSGELSRNSSSSEGYVPQLATLDLGPYDSHSSSQNSPHSPVKKGSAGSASRPRSAAVSPKIAAPDV